jgi:hypothetical protein
MSYIKHDWLGERGHRSNGVIFISGYIVKPPLAPPFGSRFCEISVDVYVSSITVQ